MEAINFGYKNRPTLEFFFYLCAHHHKLIDMKSLALGITASLNQPFPPQQFGVFRM